jgi:anti-sigma B factor antagonist
MNMTVSLHNEILVMHLKGRIMGGADSTGFSERVKEAITQGQRKIIVDLGEVEWMNSSGLGLLMSGYTALRNANGEMKLARASEEIKSLFNVTKLNLVFKTHDSLDDAAAAFK